MGEMAFNNGLSKMQKFMDFVSKPTSHIKEAIRAAVTETYYMALVCECCFEPQYNIGDAVSHMMESVTARVSPYPAPIRQPTAHLATLAIYANCTLVAARAVNMGLKCGKLFGIPTPSMSDKTLKSASDFMDGLSRSTLDGFPDLQAKVCEAAEAGGTGVSSAGDTDYCKRQLEAFLDEVDPKKHYGGLNLVNDDEGFTYFVCGECVKNYNSPQPRR